jgi:hypothetical protein
MTGSVRDEQLGGGFQPVDCAECGTTVLVRKTSPAQTSVQWQSDPSTACPYLSRSDAMLPAVVGNAGGTGDLSGRGTEAEPGRRAAVGIHPGCPALAKTIRAAVDRGLIPSVLQ